VFDEERDQGYYVDLRFHINATALRPIELVDATGQLDASAVEQQQGTLCHRDIQRAACAAFDR
jgi:hypothetical protein